MLDIGIVHGWEESCRIRAKALRVTVPTLDSIIGSPFFHHSAVASVSDRDAFWSFKALGSGHEIPCLWSCVGMDGSTLSWSNHGLKVSCGVTFLH